MSRWDQNNDGTYTISDVSLIIEKIFFLPSDLLIEFLGEHNPYWIEFLSITPESQHGIRGAVLAVVIWLLLYVSYLFIRYLLSIPRRVTESQHRRKAVREEKQSSVDDEVDSIRTEKRENRGEYSKRVDDYLKNRAQQPRGRANKG